MTNRLQFIGAAALVFMYIAGRAAAQPSPTCTPDGNVVPLGQDPTAGGDPQVPIWCYTLTPAPVTRVTGTNDWVDTFNGAPDLRNFADGQGDYRVFNSDSSGRIAIGGFTSGDDWHVDMVDTSLFRLSGGTQHSPNRPFQFENGRLVVEADAAPGDWNMGGANLFQEIDVSPARPTGVTVDGLYGYGTFGGVGAVGCRLQVETLNGVTEGETVCAEYNASNRDASGTDVTGGPAGLPGRLWETQGAGDPLSTVDVVNNPAGFWRTCPQPADYAGCLDRFRLELTKDSLKVYVNGFLQRDLEGITTGRAGQDGRLPDTWVANGVYVYFTDWINNGQHVPNRFSWSRVAVNPHDAAGNILPPSTSPTFGTPVPTPVPVTPVATSTPTPGQTCTVDVVINGVDQGRQNCAALP